MSRRRSIEEPLAQQGEYSYSTPSFRVRSGGSSPSLFLHAGLLHLAFNMLVLYWAGTILEDIYGSRAVRDLLISWAESSPTV